MRIKNVFLCVGILIIAMLAGCADKKPEENSTVITKDVEEATEADTTTKSEEATEADTTMKSEETTETQEPDIDSNEEFSSLMTEIYEVNVEAKSAEVVAEKFKDFAFTYGTPSSSETFESMANDWFQTMEETEGKDIRPEFRECFKTVTLAAQKVDETLEYDAAYLNVVNGILAAIGE